MKTTIKNSWNAVKGGVNKTVEAVKKPVKIILYTTLGFGVVGTAGAATDINYNNGEITKTTLKRSGLSEKDTNDIIAVLDRSTGDAKLPTKNTGVTTEEVYTEPEDNPTTPDAITEDDDDTTPENSETMDGTTTPSITFDTNGNITAETNDNIDANDVKAFNTVVPDNAAKKEAISLVTQINKDTGISTTDKRLLEYYTIKLVGYSNLLTKGWATKDNLDGWVKEVNDAWDNVAGTSQSTASAWTNITNLVTQMANPEEYYSLENLKKNPTFAKNYVYGVKMLRANAMGIVGDKLLAGQEISDDDKTALLVNNYIGLINGSVFSHTDKVTVVNNYYGITNYPDAHVDGEFDKLMVKTRTLMMEGDLSGVRMPVFVSKENSDKYSDVDF